MYKRVTLAFIIFISPCVVFSQDSLKQLSPFTAVDITNKGKIMIVQGDSHSIRTEPADKADKVKATVSNNTLSIDAPSDVTVYITMKTIEELSVSGWGSITSESPVKSENLHLAIGGSGKIE